VLPCPSPAALPITQHLLPYPLLSATTVPTAFSLFILLLALSTCILLIPLTAALLLLLLLLLLAS